VWVDGLSGTTWIFCRHGAREVRQEPGALVTLVRCLTVAKVNSMGLDLP
jgi:hypothetical protein